VFICPHLRLKKENLLTADDNGVTQINADKENRYLTNSDSNRFDIISQKSLLDKIAFPCKQSGKASAFICGFPINQKNLQ
jgi:hypothetical protein